MKSRLPKVLQPLAGQPLLAHALASVAALQPAQTVIVVGHGAEDVRAAFPAVKRWALLGHSMGAAVAALLAGTFPELVRWLVVIDFVKTE